jgi:hypothetical protein
VRALVAIIGIALVDACAPVRPLTVTVAATGSDGGTDESTGLKVKTELVKMNGEFEGTCALAPEPDGGAHVKLTLRSECPTVGELDITVKTVSAVAHGRVPKTLAAGVLTPVEEGPSFPLPPGGSMVRTGVTATCAGPESRKVWGACHCLMPGDPK